VVLLVSIITISITIISFLVSFHWCFHQHHGSTKRKQITTDNKRNSDEMKLFQAEMLERMERLEAGNDSKFDKIYTALDLLIAQSAQKQTHGVGLSNRPPFQVRNVKLEFPRFNGTNVHEWIFRAEQFFDYYDTPDIDRLTISSVHLDKDVVPWY
jgi:hypothetical protein